MKRSRFKVRIQCIERPLNNKILVSLLFVVLMLQGWLVLAAAATVRQIRIEHLAPFFSPNSLRVPLGTTIRWVNDTDEPHTIIADACGGTSSCRLNSGLISPHGFYDLTRLSPGRYTYHCGLHPFMRGTITVLPARTKSADI